MLGPSVVLYQVLHGCVLRTVVVRCSSIPLVCLLQGVLVAPVVPEWLQTALLAVLLAYVARKTVAKGRAQLRKEKDSLQTAPPPTNQ